mmetsp:Transcript_44991/g.101241  ORF Transcript_44991/g.101241 Transcript_44991/m.101241 type:complete len:774 (-) Transcript_44991:75-2396(-)|eukprot:CAMPEP_0197907480 /NCGR_PEP_ID=MMETSP1439-20131203/64931_1 /TAXON_ID=66791 /ORGANISM="Gonyaulax spinifera, Strain CCMP409" /LENGTH=773 /DNA_ID=CAMNT_0043528913 /DNA_START=124 /DNA_END=2445 /DNA_ORIENTATION=+
MQADDDILRAFGVPDHEQAKVAELKTAFQEELTKRKAENRCHKAFFGDLAFLRVLRGHEGHLDLAKFWYWRFIVKANESNLDDIVTEMTQKLDESGSGIGSNTMLPYYDEVKDYSQSIYTCDKPSPEGDVITYMPMIDQDKRGALVGLEWDHYVKYQRSAVVLRCLEIDRLSRKQKRLVKVILLCDLDGCSLDSLSFGAFDRPNERDVNKFAESIMCEAVDKFYIINAPWALSTLFNMVKVFLPEKLSRKSVFVSGDCLRDAEFVEQVGGEEQVKKLLDSRVGLVLKSKYAAKTSESDVSDTLPTNEEKELIAKLRHRFQDEFKRREDEGRAWSCFFGDIALTRVLRGNDGFLVPATQWFERFLKAYEKYKVDELVVEMTKKLDEGGGEFGHVSMLPYHDEIKECFRYTFTAPRLSPNGDLVSYMPLGDFDRAGVAKKINWSHWVRHVHGTAVLRCIELDRQSQRQGRMVRFMTIMDVEGSGIGITGMPSVPEFDVRHKLEAEPFAADIAAEILAANYVVSAPWLTVKAFTWFRALVPEKMTKKMHMLEGDGLWDPEFMELAGGQAQAQQLYSTKVGLVAGSVDKSSGVQDIAAGGIFHKSRDVHAGQRVKWRFTVQQGSADSLLGVSYLEFSVSASWFPDFKLPTEGNNVQDDMRSQSDPKDSTSPTLEDLEPPEKVYSGRQISGSYDSTRSGVVSLRWSNAHSRMRAKSIDFSVEVINVADVCAEDGKEKESTGSDIEASEDGSARVEAAIAVADHAMFKHQRHELYRADE